MVLSIDTSKIESQCWWSVWPIWFYGVGLCNFRAVVYYSASSIQFVLGKKFFLLILPGNHLLSTHFNFRKLTCQKNLILRVLSHRLLGVCCVLIVLTTAIISCHLSFSLSSVYRHWKSGLDMISTRTADRAESVICLPWKPEDLSSSPRTHVKKARLGGACL